MQYDKDLESEHKELFLEAREFLLSFNGIIETRKERITTYSNEKGGICHMRTMPYGIDFGFLKGAKMEDPFNLLTGNGKVELSEHNNINNQREQNRRVDITISNEK